jgi:thiamine biosynthesis lipoprotein
LGFKKRYLLLILILASCMRSEPSRTELALGTICTITLFDQAKDGIYKDIFNRIHEIENLMSVNIADSDVSRINEASGIAPVRVHEDVFKVIERAVYFAQASDGAFEPTVEPLVYLWDIGGDAPRIPSRIEIMITLPLVNWRDIELDAENKTVFLKRKGMGLDLGAIAKGYAADEAAAILKTRGIKRAIIDLGGNIIVCGEKKDKSPWRVGIQNPDGERGAYLGVLQIAPGTERTVVTSGVNERYFIQDGKRWHHIFSPATGYPADNGLLSVTVIAANSMDADALSTAAFVLGWEKGLALLESFPGTEAVFVFEDLIVRATDGAEFILTDNSFQIKPTTR